MKRLLPFIPSHYTYVEPFGGGASLLFAKPLSPVEIYNDLDSGVVNLFRVVRSQELFPKFQRLVESTPYARAEFLSCQQAWADETDPVQKAHQFFIVARMSFSGDLRGGFSTSITESARGMSRTTSRHLSTIKRLPEIHKRLMEVQIEHEDWRTILDRYDTPRTFFYLDPPYVPSTRVSGTYSHELSEDDHRELVSYLLRLEGMALLSGYPNKIYNALLEAGWVCRTWDAVCHAAGKTRYTQIHGEGSARKLQPRTEAVWSSPKNKMELSLFPKLDPAPDVTREE